MQLITEETGYRLIFEGKIAGNQDKDVVLKKVAEIYGKQPDEVQKLFSGKRIVIKKNTSLSVCKKIAKRFNIVGAICSIETINQSEEAVHDAGEKPESQLISIKNHKDFDNTGNMHYSEIIKKITEDLTGNVAEDIDYLLKARDQYINHRFSIEICRAIGRLLYRILPNDKKEEIEKYFEKLNLSTDILLNDAKDKLAAGDLDGAEKIVISIIPDDNYFPEDNASIYFSFKNLFEFFLFQHLYNPEKKIRLIPNNLSECLHLYAYILFEKEDYGSAEKFLNFGLKYNPIDLHLLFEKNEVNKIRKDWENYKKINDFCIKVSYLSSDIARAYRNYGYMFIELKDYDAAICSYLMSVQYEKSEHANSQLLYISQVKKKNINFKKYMKKIEKILNKRSVQVGPSEEVIGTAVAVGKIYENDNQIEEALYFYGIAYSITDDSDLLQKIKGIQEKLAQ